MPGPPRASWGGMVKFRDLDGNAHGSILVGAGIMVVGGYKDVEANLGGLN